jgi:hypothetical protein
MNKAMSWISSHEAAKREARMLLRNLQQKDVAPVERYRQFDATDVFPARLSDAQYLVARHYGFESWAALTEFLTSRTMGTIKASKREPKKRKRYKQRRREDLQEQAIKK